MLGNKKCPYCEENLERSLISGPSALYKDDIRYIGCSECGKTSLLYKNEEVAPIMAPKSNSSTITEALKKDIDKAFTSPEAMPIINFDLKKAINESKVKPIVFGKTINDTNPERGMKALENLRKGLEKESFVIKPLKQTTSDDKMEELFSKICESIVKKIENDSEKVNKSTPKVETTELKIEEDKKGEQAIMNCRTFMDTPEVECKEERKSYVLIDEYNETYTYLNVTLEELLAKMEDDGHDEDEYDNMKLYELKNPLRFKKSITIE